jgi:hypothetical protein
MSRPRVSAKNLREETNMKTSQWLLQSFIALTVAVGALTTVAMRIAAAQAGGDQEIIPVNANAYGNTYGEWCAEWWQWALSIPAAHSPIADTTGKDCTQKQSGPVFYLAGTAGGGAVKRSCTVPKEKALFFPILNALWGAAVGDCVPTNPAVICNLADLRKLAADSMDSVTLKAVIDGEPVENLHQQRVQSPALTITLPDTAPYAPNVSDGYWLLLPPLPAGGHTVYFKGTVTGGPFQGFVVEVTYKLTVQ